MLGEGRNCGPFFLCRVLVERPLLVVLTSCTQLGCMQRGSEDTESNYADTLFHNGFDEGIDALKGPETRVIDLGGKMVMPSFQDIHIHPIFAGREARSKSMLRR